MANIDAPFGLRPVRHANGAPYNGAATPMFISGTYATALFVGDPVVRIAAGSNTKIVDVPGYGSFPQGTLPAVVRASVGDTERITGVIVGFAAQPTDLETKWSKASTQGVALVTADPDLVYEIQADGAIPAASIGLNAVLIATHAGSTNTGLSGMELDTTSDTPEANASNQLRILASVNRPDNDTTITHAKVLVQINKPTEATSDAGTLGI